MPGSAQPSQPASRPSRTLLIVAAPAELAAALRGLGAAGHPRAGDTWALIDATDRVDVAISGVGKANAAGAAARLFDPSRHRGIVNVGVAGALPAPGGAPELGAAVLATRSVYADEGMLSPDGFRDIASMGFPPAIVGPTGAESSPGVGAPADAALAARLRPLADLEGAVATVSTCSGTDELAREIAERSGAVAEAMEGAAIAFTCRRLGGAAGGGPIPFAELRVISNTTGRRKSQRWDLKGSLQRLEAVCSAIEGALVG